MAGHIRRKQVQKRRAPGPSGVVPSASRALMVMEQAPLRRAAIAECFAMQKKLDAVRLEAKEYEDQDEPVFRNWFLTLFEDEIKKLRTLENVISEKEVLLEAMKERILLEGLSPKQAYREVMDEFHESQVQESFQWDHGQPEDDDAAAGSEGGFHDETRQSFEEAEKPRESRRRKKDEPKVDSLKQLYRTLARTLHPDLNGELTDEQRSLWLQVQEAYEKGDLARLRAIAVSVQITEGNVSEDVQVSSLWMTYEHLKKSYGKHLQHHARLKKLPGWKFAAKSTRDRTMLEKKLRVAMSVDLESAETHLENLEAILDEIAHTSAKRGRRSPFRKDDF